jgi:hypothetical protein
MNLYLNVDVQILDEGCFAKKKTPKARRKLLGQIQMHYSHKKTKTS